MAALSIRTVSRRISGCLKTGFSQRAVAARVSPDGQPPERDGEPPDRPESHPLHDSPNIRGESLPVRARVSAGEARREVVEGFA